MPNLPEHDGSGRGGEFLNSQVSKSFCFPSLCLAPWPQGGEFDGGMFLLAGRGFWSCDWPGSRPALAGIRFPEM